MQVDFCTSRLFYVLNKQSIYILIDIVASVAVVYCKTCCVVVQGDELRFGGNDWLWHWDIETSTKLSAGIFIMKTKGLSF